MIYGYIRQEPLPLPGGDIVVDAFVAVFERWLIRWPKNAAKAKP